MAGNREVVVVDGANVAYEEKTASGKPKVSNINAVRRALEEAGYEPIIVADASLKYEVDDQEQFEAMVEGQVVRQVPAGTDADFFIIQIAEQHGARIVTNDQYKDYQEQYPSVRDRRLCYMIVKGEVHFYDNDSGPGQ